MTITSKAFLFSLDLMIAFLLLTVILFASLAHSFFLVNNALHASASVALEQKAIALADSLVKNRNVENPLLGSAVLDPARHRVLSNVMDASLLARLEPQALGGVRVSQAYVRDSLSFRVLFSEDASGACVTVERVILLEGVKALGLVVCR